MGTRDLSSRRTDAHPRAVHRLRAVAALIALGAATPALAEGTAVVPYQPQTPDLYYKMDSLAGEPAMRQPNMRLQNFMGRLYESKLLKVGVAAGGAAMNAKELSGAAVQAYTRSQSFGIAERLKNAGLSAAVEGAKGCGTGLILGALPAVVSGGLTMAAGCMWFGATGAVLGALNGAMMPLDEEGKINVDAQGKLIGDYVRKAVAEAEGERLSASVDAGFRYDNVGNVIVADQSKVDGALNRFGVFRLFPCGSAYGNAGTQACMFIPRTYNQSYGWVFNPFSDAMTDYNNRALTIPAFTACGRYVPCPSSGAFVSFIEASGCSHNNGSICPMLSLETAPYSSASSVPASKLNPIGDKGGMATGIHDGQLDKAAADLRVSSEALAALANSVWKHASDNNTPGVPPFNPSNPITKSDVDGLKAQSPSGAPRVGDLVRPYDVPGTEPPGSSSTDPRPAPLPVVVTNPSTGGSSGTETTVKEADPETELDNDDGLLGDVMKPAKDFLTDTLAPWMSAKVELPPASCPVVSIDLPTLLGRQDISNPQDSTMMCDWMEQQRPKFLAFLHVIFIFLACRKAMEA